MRGDLADALVEQAREVKLSKDEQPDAEDFFIPPLNNANQLSHVSGLVERAPAHASVLTGGERVTEGGYFYAPTVVDGLQQGDEMAQTEIFGPVITVQSFSDESEALRWANGTDYGLASSVWTSNHKRALRMSRALDCDIGHVGRCHVWLGSAVAVDRPATNVERPKVPRGQAAARAVGRLPCLCTRPLKFEKLAALALVLIDRHS